MSPPKSQMDPIEEKLDEVARLLALLLKRDRPLSEAITEMGSVGFGQTRISELVGTSRGYVDNIIQAAKKPKAKKTLPKKKGK